MFERPLLLLLLLLAPLVAAPDYLVWRRTGGWSRIGPMALRLLCFAALVGILAGPLTQTQIAADKLAVVVALDQSSSIAPDQQSWMEDQLARIRAAMTPLDRLAVIGFGRDARLLAALSDPRLMRLSEARADAGATDIAGALTSAAGVFPPEMEKKLILLSDGNETQNSAIASVPLLVEDGIQLYAAAPPASSARRLALVELGAPTRLRAYNTAALKLSVESESPQPVHARVSLAQDGVPIGAANLSLHPGLNHFEVPYQAEKPGAYVLSARLEAPPMLTVLNQLAETPLLVAPPPHILLVSRQPTTSLDTALKLRKYGITQVGPEALSAKSDDYLQYQAVVLVDSSAQTLSIPAQRALAGYVRDFGGGLVVTGDTLREENFADGPLEAALPIKFVKQPPPPSREPLGIYLCIDRSNSMSYNSRFPTVRDNERIRYAKQSAVALLNQLDDSDYVGVIAFDSQPYVIARLHPVAEDRAALQDRIMRLEPGGGTDFKEALEIASQDLVKSGLTERQIILLTDGDTNRQYHEHDSLIAQLAGEHIPISTIRIGPDQANVRLLEDFAEATGGVFYRVNDIEKLPQLFIRLSRQAMKSPMGRLVIQEQGHSSILKGISQSEIPPLEFYSLTQAKDGATVPLTIERNGKASPLLAVWQYGLGRSAAFATDPDSLASLGWIHWNRYSEFWSQLLTWTMRQADSGPLELRVSSSAEGVPQLRAESPLPTALTNLYCIVSNDNGRLLEVALSQVTPTSYEGQLPPLPPGKYLAELRTGNGKTGHRLVRQPFAVTKLGPVGPAELRLRPPDRELLQRLAAAGGGKFNAPPAEILQRRGARITARENAAPYLMPFAILMLLAEVLVRRRLLG